MRTSLRNKILTLAIFLFLTLLVACSQTNKNVTLAVITKTLLLVLPSQTLTPKTSIINDLTPTHTLGPDDATLSAQFVTSKARTAATRTAAYATLASRNAVCDNGYRFIYFADDALRKLDYFPTNAGDNWTVIECLPEQSNSAKGYTKVINSDGSKIWRISFESFTLPGNYTFLSGYKIDTNGDYLYLIPRHPYGGMGLCPSCLFGFGSPLYRLELSSGKLTTILPYIDNGSYVDIAISPDARYLIYSDSRDGNTVYIQDLINGNSQKIKLGSIYIINGGFTWTPDSKNLVFAAGLNGWEKGKAGISLFRLNLKTMNLQTLLLNDNRNLVPWLDSDSSKIWLNDNILNLASIKISGQDFSSNEWSINVKTGEVIPLSTLTP
jgi:hypothetical protein